MELLESQRRILSPGCCTEEREVGREGGREGGREEGKGGRDRGWETKEGRGTELRTCAECNPYRLYKTIKTAEIGKEMKDNRIQKEREINLKER